MSWEKIGGRGEGCKEVWRAKSIAFLQNAKSEMSVRHPNKNAKQTVIQMGLELGGDNRVGHTHTIHPYIWKSIA